MAWFIGVVVNVVLYAWLIMLTAGAAGAGLSFAACVPFGLLAACVIVQHRLTVKKVAK